MCKLLVGLLRSISGVRRESDILRAARARIQRPLWIEMTRRKMVKSA